jgi:type I restriction enzyme M protein
LQPEEGMEIYDPTVGSGGMLIQSKKYVEESGGDVSKIDLFGQEDSGTTWSICKMNMILHGVGGANIQNEDTLAKPQHVDANGEIRSFSRVIANPPFSQNYSRDGMTHQGRFDTWLPEGGKKADFMFVQHMVASLKQNGKMAVVMPHGVLFRGGEERICRQRFIEDGILEAVIGLPQGLFYGTGIPACVLIINKANAASRDHVVFINADREYKEGKNQNSLRPEDIEKITHVYTALTSDTTEEIAKYARAVSIEELKAEEFNLNIRRYVDNSPAPEPHDVKAHLNGGVPSDEVNSLENHWQNYSKLKEGLFSSGHLNQAEGEYFAFNDVISDKPDIKSIIENHPQLVSKHQNLNTQLDIWWCEHFLPDFYQLGDELLGSKGVFALRREALNSIVKALLPENLLSIYQIRGAMASNFKQYEADLKSIANSGWNAELIPDEEILQSQFPEVLANLKKDAARITELEGLFAAANEVPDDESEDESDSAVLPKSQVKQFKDAKKENNGQIRDLKKGLKFAKKEDPARALELENRIEKFTIANHKIDKKLAQHVELEKELKGLGAGIKESEKKKDDLIEAARNNIEPSDAQILIEKRFKQQMQDSFNQYIRQLIRQLIKAVENLHNKYAVTVKNILSERDKQAKLLDSFLQELGYE